ncbi:hypothetical protein V7S43_005918 [Phytophthora oleae]|uniref:RxLR effector protein n=1 Tax=Phytophthora oleae TaxID=2107226 RepID=A0ABD3FQ87_9STRA
MTSVNAAGPVRALETSNGKRSLRTYYEEDKYDEEEEEERGVMSVEQVAKWTSKVDEWVKLGYKPAGMREKLSALNGVMSQKNRRCSWLPGDGRTHRRSEDARRDLTMVEVKASFFSVNAIFLFLTTT